MIKATQKFNLSIILSLIFVLKITQSVFAQNISIRQNIFEFPGICYQTTFTIIIRNDENTDWNQNVLTIQLPCGFEYIPGSMTNGSESDINNLSKPEFSIGTLSKGSEKSISFKTIPNCTAFECLNSGMTFTNEFTIVSPQGIKSISSDNYNVETPNLIITQINSPFMEGEVGTVTERKMTVKNTRLGRLKSFRFQDVYDPSIDINIEQGNVLAKEQGKIIVEIGAEDFKKIGNLDSLFDFNEEIVITEKITSGGCVLESRYVQSDMQVSWGCKNADCQSNAAKATFRMIPKADIGDKLSFTSLVKNPICYLPGSAEQVLTVRVAPTITDLTKIKLEIQHPVIGRNIVVGSVVVPAGFQVNYEDITINECMTEIAKKAIITAAVIPADNALRTFDIRFTSAFCEEPGCNPASTQWKTSYEYEKKCSQEEDIFYSGTFTGSSTNQNVVKSEVSVLVNDAVSDGKAGAIRYTLTSAAVRAESGTLRIKLQIPAFLEIIPTNYAIGVKVPVVEEVIMDRNRMITLSYTLPFPTENPLLNIPFIANCSDTTLLPCKDSISSSCPDLCVVSDNNEIILSDAWIILTPECPIEGAIRTCDEVAFRSNCTHGYCIEELNGYVNFDVNTKRLTLGLPDKNGDHIPDDDGIFDESLLNLNTVYLGDTFVLNIFGEVVMEKPGETYENAVIQVHHTKIISQSNVGPDIIEKGIQAYSNRLIIFDKSSQQKFTIEDIPFEFKDLQYTYDISPGHLKGIYPDLPTNFQYDDGDSIILNVYKVFNRNFPTPFVGWNGHELMFEYAPKIALTNGAINHGSYYLGCGCPNYPVTVIGYNAWSQSFIPGVAQCPGQTNISSILCNYGYSYPSPGEIKFYQKPKGFRIGKTEFIQFDSLAVSTGTFPEKIYTQYTETDDAYYIDISEFTKYRNFRAGLRFWLYRTAEKCINAPIPNTFCELLFDQAPQTASYISDKVSYSLQNVVTVPNIQLELHQKEFTALQPKVEFPLTMINKVNSQVRNIYIRPVYDPQSFTDVSIKLSGLPVQYPEINGYFVLGNLFSNENRNLIFEAKGKQCGRKRIIFEYGYDCEVYSNPAEEPCFLKSDTLYIDFQNGELELIAQVSERTIFLCDTINESSFTVYNGGLGNVFNIKPSVFIPRGLEFVEGSCTIMYPSQSGQTFQIPEPQLVSGRWFQWDLSSLWPVHAAEGLSAVSQAPLNSFDISYRTRSDCQFISGSQERFSIKGEQVCGTASNQVSKAGPVLKLDNIPEDVEIDIVVSAPDVLFCTAEAPVQIQYINDHVEDSQLFVNLPPGVKIVDNSFSGNLPINIPVNNGGILEWFVPQGISNVVIQFSIVAVDSASCIDDFMEISTSRSVNLFCQSEQSFCDIQNITGKQILPLVIQKQQVFIDTLRLTKHADSSFYSLSAVFRFEAGNMPVYGKIIYDKDQNGIINQLDSVLQIVQVTPGVNFPDIIHREFIINPNKIPDFCHIWMILDTSNCLCSHSAVQVYPVIEFRFDTLDLCWNEKAEIGVGERPQKSYQWNLQQGLDCTQCGLADFQDPNDNGNEVRNYIKILRETDLVTGCVNLYQYILDVYPKQQIQTPSIPLCKGDTLSVTATNFSTFYQWSGSGIIFNENETIRLTTDSARWVYLTMSDSIGCVEKDSFFVDVRLTPPVNFINDGQFCYGQEAIVGYIPETGIEYAWIDPGMLLSNPNGTMSSLQDNSEGFVYVAVDNGGCTRLDSLFISHYKGLNISGAQDTFFICQGDSLTIELSGANQYEWSDPAIGSCLNDSCSMFLVIPETVGTLNTSVIGFNSEGCKDTVSFTIVSISTSEIITSEEQICPGDTITFFNHIINEQGLYCDTVSFGACHYIQCLEVHIKPPLIREVNENICQGDTLFYNGMMFSEAGSHEWTFQGADGCDSLVTLNIGLLPGPEINVPPNIEINIGGTTIVNFPNQYIYQWSPSTGLDCNTCSTVTITGNEDILYQVTVTDPSGCTAIYSLQVNVNNICNIEILEIPNAFSPNGDLINDLFTIPDLQVCEISIIVFNRWGNIVYEQKPFDNQWDGKSLNETDLPSGTYYYIIETYDKSVKKTGMIDLRRE